MGFLPERSAGSAGFSLLEILVGLAVSGFLLAMVTKVVGQAAVNDTVIREHSALSSQVATLRRILHRDLQNIDLNELMYFAPTGFEFVTTNTVLYDGPLPIHVGWLFELNKIERVESQQNLDYEQRQVLLTGIKSWSLNLYDPATSRSRSLDSVLLGTGKMLPGSLALELEFDSGMKMTIVERVPNDYEPD